MDEQDIIDSFKPICICKGIKKGVFTKEINRGADTLEQLRQDTGAGTGSCHGRRCTPRIQEMLKKLKG